MGLQRKTPLDRIGRTTRCLDEIQHEDFEGSVFKAQSFASPDDAEAEWERRKALGRCRECGDLLDDGYVEEYAERIRAEKVCFDCLHWIRWLAYDEDPHMRPIVDGQHYHIQPDAPKDHRGFLGFGGAKFHFRFFDGHEVVSHNTWTQGKIPAHFRARLPNNAEFVRG